MYGTLRYATKGGNSSLVSHLKPCNPALGQEKHLACDRCRSKKLKCSGQKSGCSRCKASSSTCSYFTPANAVVSKPRKQSSSTSKEQSNGDSSSDGPQAASRPTVENSNESDNPAPNHEPAEPQSGDSSAARTPGEEGHDQYMPDFTVNSSGLDENDTFAATLPHSLDWHHPPSNILQACQSEGQFSSKHIPQWLWSPDTDDMDFTQLVGGVFSPDESLQMQNVDLSTFHFGATDDMDTDSVHGVGARDLKDSFSLSLNNLSSYKEQAQQNPDQARSSSTSFTRRKSQPPPRQLPSPPQLSSSSASNTPPEAPQRQISDTREQASMASLSVLAHTSAKGCDGLSMEAPQQPCGCLQMTAAMLEEIEVKSFSEGATSIDVMMNFHQEALGELDTILGCGSCVNRSEILMLLAMAMDKLVSFMEKACVRYKQELCNIDAGHSTLNLAIAANPGNTSSGVSHDARSRVWQRGRHNSIDGSSLSSTSPSSLAYSPLCGSYKVRSAKDWACLVNVLLCLQLRTLAQSLKTMRAMPYIARRQSHLAIISGCESRVQKLRRSMSS